MRRNGRALIVVLLQHGNQFILLSQLLLILVLLGVHLILLELDLLLGVLQLLTHLAVRFLCHGQLCF